MSKTNAAPDARSELLISCSPGEARWALREAGVVVALGVERVRAGVQTGDLYLARVRAIVPSANAAFVDLDGQAEGFLSGREARRKAAFADVADSSNTAAAGMAESDDIARLVTEGEALVVQVKRPALGDKAAQVTTAVSIAGPRLVLTPGRREVLVSRRIADEGERARLTELAGGLAGEAGLILRTAAAGAVAAVLEDEAGHLVARWRALRETAREAAAPAALAREATPLTRVLRDHAGSGLDRILLDERAALGPAKRWLADFVPDLADRVEAVAGVLPLFTSEGVDDAIEAALTREVGLAGGGSLIIDPAAALTAIDVNTGGRAGRQNRVILETNLAAAAEAARQIRLRNLGGLIAIDFVRMRERRDRDRVLEVLREALAAMVPEAQLGGFTRFGLVEIVRPHDRAALHEAMCTPTHFGGWRRSAETVALEALRAALGVAAAHPGRSLALRAAPAVIDQLAGPLQAAHREAEDLLGLAITLGSAPDNAETDYETFDISPA
ncbi:MAG: ribonuclease E/G [Alphaproteobacteria bacterium]|nr:ribonuclease E/G [Alphaproteobacteria bacterium]